MLRIEFRIGACIGFYPAVELSSTNWVSSNNVPISHLQCAAKPATVCLRAYLAAASEEYLTIAEPCLPFHVRFIAGRISLGNPSHSFVPLPWSSVKSRSERLLFVVVLVFTRLQSGYVESTQNANPNTFVLSRARLHVDLSERAVVR